MRKLLLYGYVTHTKVQKKSEFHNSDFPLHENSKHKTSRVHLLNPLLYGTAAKVRKKSVFHNTDLLKNRLTMKSKKILPRVTYNAKLSKLYETPIPM